MPGDDFLIGDPRGIPLHWNLRGLPTTSTLFGPDVNIVIRPQDKPPIIRALDVGQDGGGFVSFTYPPEHMATELFFDQNGNTRAGYHRAGPTTRIRQDLDQPGLVAIYTTYDNSAREGGIRVTFKSDDTDAPFNDSRTLTNVGYKAGRLTDISFSDEVFLDERGRPSPYIKIGRLLDLPFQFDHLVDEQGSVEVRNNNEAITYDDAGIPWYRYLWKIEGGRMVAQMVNLATGEIQEISAALEQESSSRRRIIAAVEDKPTPKGGIPAWQDIGDAVGVAFTVTPGRQAT